MSFKNFNWNNIRPINGDVKIGFEELCCQLAYYEKMPIGSIYTRKGTPDGGVECFWKLSDNSEICYQAKFFINSPTNSEWCQIKKSLYEAVNNHQNLTQYIVCLPLNFSDGSKTKTKNQKTALDKWNEYIKKWEADIKIKFKKKIRISYWGETEIIDRLSKPEHRGRYYFWFNKDLFTNEWFNNFFNETKANVGARYSPEINITLPINKVFDTLLRNDTLFFEIRKLRAELLKQKQELNFKDKLIKSKEELLCLHKKTDALIDYLNEYISGKFVYIDITKIVSLISDIITQSNKLNEIINQTKNEYKEKNDYEYKLHSINKFRRKLYEIENFFKQNHINLINQPFLLICGDAGQGKTHLFCEIISRQILSGKPALLFLGMNFKNNDPWKQMLDRIGLNCSREEFLGALNALGQLSNQRCLILIDALNESEERHFWKTYIAGMIEVAEQYEYLSIGYSIRATYEDTVIPDELLKNNKLIRIVHNGFNDLGFEAIRQFFNFYKLEIPSIPLLLPEYYNPMFLKIFCENLKAEGKSKITKGGVELTKIFDGFVSRVNKNLAAPKYLDFNPKQNIVRNIIYALTEEMFKTNQNWIKYDDAEKIINEIIPAKNKGYSNSPIKYLESENIIFQNRYLVSFNPSKYEDGVTLIYDKFTDYLKAKYIIENCPTFTILKKKIEELINSYNYGIVDMLSVLLPENKDKELFEYIEISNKNENRIIESFLNSLIWRSPSTITEKTFDFINKYIIKYEKSLHNFFDIVISLAAFEKHPLNILRLHDFFIKLPMAERDYIWTLYLNKNYEKGNIIYNTIEWANNFDNVKTLSVESSELYSILVGWFLTSSNRFLRDRATKALVFLLSNNPQIIVNILDKFKEVNDDYILERLVAAAYGASMIIKNNNLLKTLAQYIYDWQFNNNSPLSNILFRDYCREIIELALHRKLKLNINIDNIRPPYKSEWPSFKIPTLRSLEKYGKFNDKYPEHEKYKNAIINIYSSVLSWGDFARYIIGTNSNRSYWKKLKLNSKKKYMIPQTREKNFLDSLTTNQTEFLKKYFDIRQKVFHNDLLERIGRTPEETKNTQENAKILDSELQKKKNDLLNSLNSKKRKEFNDFFDEYSSNSHNYYQKELFDLKVIQRWVFQKVLNLGWEVDKFGYYDWHLNRYGGDYRSPHKVERIGKKYQWIALYECLARIADNFQFSDEYGGIYEGPWQIGRREIDPSCLLYNTKRQDWFENHHQTWYFPVIYNSWNKFKTEIDWIKTTEDLPDLNSLLEVESCDKEKWYLLNASYNWKESITIETEILNKKYKEIWYMIKSYFIKKKDKEKLTEWLEKQNFYGRWMTEESELRHIFMGEMFWSPAYKNEILEYENLSWIKPNSYNKIPVDIMVSCCEYIIEDSGYDCSIDESILIYMPCELLFNKLNIQSTADFGEYYNHKNELIAIDPSIELNGPGAFLIKQDSLKSFLNENNLDIFWIVMGEKRIFDNASLYARKNHPGMLEISGYSFLNDQTNLKTKIKGKYFKK